ncbi:hypothetical protein GPALN_004100 [Globodera pallida]|nr:hypothetical protein GPALN_004100 [Globodera pallida]
MFLTAAFVMNERAFLPLLVHPQPPASARTLKTDTLSTNQPTDRSFSLFLALCTHKHSFVVVPFNNTLFSSSSSSSSTQRERILCVRPPRSRLVVGWLVGCSILYSPSFLHAFLHSHLSNQFLRFLLPSSSLTASPPSSVSFSNFPPFLSVSQFYLLSCLLCPFSIYPRTRFDFVVFSEIG